MKLIGNPSLTDLRRAVAIKEQITALETELAGILGSPVRRKTRASLASNGRGHAAGKPARGSSGRKRRKLNAKARAKLAASARARWAKVKAAGKNRL